MAGIVHLKPLLSLGLFPLLSLSCCFSLGLQQASAQIIPDNTLGLEPSRITTVNDIRELIEGGAIRDSNLFHSFEQFNIGEGREVYFANPAGIENILGRVTGNDISNIFGTLGVDGMANLFLINPNGIIFGPNARLDIGGSFVASTAEQFAFSDGNFFSAVNPEAPPLLTINITPGLQYGRRQPAPVVNTGNLRVGQAQSLTLTGGTVVTTGELAAPGGEISLAALPSHSLVKLGADAQLLGWEQLPITGESLSGVSTLSVAELVERAGLGNEGIPVDFNSGSAIASGLINVSSTQGVGGITQVLGNQVELFGATVNASGIGGGGTVLIGGDFLGNGTVPKAVSTFVGSDVTINADALITGDGGKVIVWGHQTANIQGTLTARGGIVSGNGGFIETSGKQFLNLTSTPDASAPNGSGGTWLIDPTDITIINGSGGAIGTNTVDVTNINTALNTGTNVTITTSIGGTDQGNITQNNDAAISKTAGGDATLTLQAENDIVLNGEIISSSGQLNVQLLADSDDSGAGAIGIFGATIDTNGGNFIGSGKGLGIANNSSIRSQDGNIDLIGTGGIDAENALGLGIGSNSVVESTTGDITLNGIGGSGIDFAHGLTIADNSIIRSQDGNINLMGTGGSNAPNTDGIGIVSNSVVESTGKGTITMMGIGGSGGDAQGIVIGFDNARVSSTDGNIILIGTGNGNGSTIFGDHGILIFNGGVLESSGTGDITLNGIGGNANEMSNAGISIEGVLRSSGTGDITLNGIGGNGTGEGNYGILIGEELTIDPGMEDAEELITNPGVVEATGTGNITLEGIGGQGTDNNSGIRIQSDGSVVRSTGTGNISLTGTSNGTGNNNKGILIYSGGVVETTNGSIDLEGISGSGVNFNDGIQLINPGSRISTENGNITLTGTAAASNGDRNHGISMFNGGLVQSAGSGSIEITGTSNATGDSGFGNDGISIVDFSGAEATGTGAITMTGTGGEGTVSHQGIVVLGSGARVTSVSGDIFLTGTSRGTGSGHYGIWLGRLGGGVVGTTGTGNITLEGIISGIGNNSEGIFFGDTAVVEATGTGNINLTADEITIAPNFVEIRGTNLLQIQPLDPTLGITIGGTTTDTSLNLDSSELGILPNEFSQIIIGRDNSSGAITVLPVNFNNPTTIQAPVTGGTITTTGAINTNNNPLTFIAGSDITFNNDINTGNGNLSVL
ncbi:MAG: filamentous hemagglutinin N-terminal domain-containing protein, partial [Symploca sp. SIO1C4]|nr:filamentous hemagglutinin N-terminal domain-containing protein [Symploca sp. SIO1C4]